MKHFLSCLLLIASSSFSWTHAESITKPNIVFILCDDLGWVDTSLEGGSKYYQTPNLQRLAKRGMLFHRAYSASPLCSPTRASILTGQNPARIGITSPNCHLPEVILKASVSKTAPAYQKALECVSATRLDTSYFTIAEALKVAGYATGHFGKWHLGAEPYSPLQQGFDVDVPHYSGPGPAGSFVAPWKFSNFKPRSVHEHLEDRMSDEAVAWIEKNKEHPFFLNYWQFSVHAPFDAKKDLIEKYRKLIDPKNPQHSPTYAAMVESMDDSVGKLLDTLERLGIADRTAVVFFSDNGGNMYNTIDETSPTSNAPLRGGKATVYEGGVRVPCIISWPGITKANTISEQVIQSCDFYPTILELLGLPAQPQQKFDGISIKNALTGGELDRKSIFTFFPHSPGVPDTLPPAATVLENDWKLIRIFHQGENGAHGYRLYHLSEDIGEMNDLAAQQPQRVKEMDARLSQFFIDTNAVVPQINPQYDPAAKVVVKDQHQVKSKLKKKDQEVTWDGWKARGCEITKKDGVLFVKGITEDPFMGFSAQKYSDASTITFRIRAVNGGKGKITWLAGMPQETPEQSVDFTIKNGDWQEISVAIPARGSLGILRLYVPAQHQQVEIDSISLKDAKQEQKFLF